MSLPEIVQVVQAAATIVAAIGVALAYRELKLTQEQAVTQFEDSLAREYREIARRIPVGALLGEHLGHPPPEDLVNEIYNYIDLSNEQVFLRQLGRVREDTWENWREGMKTNLQRPAFREAWDHIKQRSEGSFEELRRLEEGDFAQDPLKWGKSHFQRSPKEALPGEPGP